MGTEWAIVVAAAVTGVLTLLGASVPKIVDTIRDKNERDAKEAAKRTTALATFRRVYLAGYELIDQKRETAWMQVIAAAADCIPYTEPGSEARDVLVQIIGRTRVDTEKVIAVLPES